MSRVGAFKKVFVGVGVLIAIGVIGSTVGSGVSDDKNITISSETQKQVETSLGDKGITVSAETQNQIETSLIGEKKAGYFSVGDGEFVFAERR